jgi:hypothetical protein
VIHPADRLSRLPDEILAQILSFLPAQEAVRTCVLARAWRDVWKFTRRLFITGGTVQLVREFVDRLLRLRLNGLKCASLDECEIMFRMQVDDDDDVNSWIRTSLKCQVQTLRVLNEDEQPGIGALFEMSHRSLISTHLTRLELSGVLFECINLNLDGCPALEHVGINECYLAGVRKIMAPSLKSLVITECESREDDLRFKISAPCLVSLWLEVGAFRTPLLESMPKLVEAYVWIDSYWGDNCYCNDPMGCYHVMQAPISDGDVDGDNEEDTEDYAVPNTQGCVLFEGLAKAKHLVLLADHSTVHLTLYAFFNPINYSPFDKKIWDPVMFMSADSSHIY